VTNSARRKKTYLLVRTLSILYPSRTTVLLFAKRKPRVDTVCRVHRARDRCPRPREGFARGGCVNTAPLAALSCYCRVDTTTFLWRPPDRAVCTTPNCTSINNNQDSYAFRLFRGTLHAAGPARGGGRGHATGAPDPPSAPRSHRRRTRTDADGRRPGPGINRGCAS
jgi:hypothetical protein